MFSGFIQQIWAKFGIDKIAMLKNGVTLVRFENANGRDDVIEGGIFHFDKKPVVVKAWNPDLELTSKLNSVPVWLKLHGLDMKLLEPFQS